MKSCSVIVATSIALTAPLANAATLTAALPADGPGFTVPQADTGATLLRVKDDKGEKGHKHKKKAEKAAKKERKEAHKEARKEAKKARKDAEKAHKQAHKDLKHARKADKKTREHRLFHSADERRNVAERILAVPAPQNRDMSALLAAAPLALLGSNVVLSDVPDEEFLTYRNCPPGLAKKDPPCVPPGLAKKGVTYEEWVSYEEGDLDRLLDDRRRELLDDRTDDQPLPEEVDLLLTSEEIARLYDLAPAPAGKRYALIDGLPVMLEEKDYLALLRVNELARYPDLDDSVQIAPTAALTQAELQRAYRLPQLEPGYNYAVVNGEVLVLEDSAFETLQLIRIARAVL